MWPPNCLAGVLVSDHRQAVSDIHIVYALFSASVGDYFMFLLFTDLMS